MPGSRVWSFGDPDEYVAHVRSAKAEVALTRPGRFKAKLIHIDLPRLWMQRFSDSLPRVAHYDLTDDRAVVSFMTRRGPSSLWNGVEEQTSRTLRRHRPGDRSFQRTSGASHFGSMSLPADEMDALGGALVGRDLRIASDSRQYAPTAAAMRRLVYLHTAAGHLAEYAPEVIANPEAARGLEQALIDALAACLSSAEDHKPVPGSRRRDRIMKRFFEVLVANPEGVLHLAEMCATVGVSTSTLTACCNEAVGMSPHRFLRIRQLNLARQALARADARATTVTEVATEHGFWELGRFAVAYKALFGERPSETLGRAPDAAGPPLNLQGMSPPAIFA